MARLGPRFDRPGTPPGTLREHVNPREPVRIRRFRYSDSACEEDQPANIDEALAGREGAAVTWIDVVGLGDTGLLRRMGERLDLHPLTLEDVVNTWQRPKVESYDDYLFVVMRIQWLAKDALAGPSPVGAGGAAGAGGDDRTTLESEQISMFLGPDWVVTVQEVDCEPLQPVRDRVASGKGRIRRLGADYLGYAIIDALVDNYFPVLERYGDRLEQLEALLLANPNPSVLARLHELKKDLLQLRRTAWPQREVLNSLARSETTLIGAETRLFVRDGYDHAVQILDIVESYRDVANGLTDLYLSSLSHRTNEVMRLLTVISSIFIPLTFIAGIYGMNFDPGSSPLNMPELGWFWGYPTVIGLMLLVGGGMAFYFKKKGWL
jgi:magnesium transporter